MIYCIYGGNVTEEETKAYVLALGVIAAGCNKGKTLLIETKRQPENPEFADLLGKSKAEAFLEKEVGRFLQDKRTFLLRAFAEQTLNEETLKLALDALIPGKLYGLSFPREDGKEKVRDAVMEKILDLSMGFCEHIFLTMGRYDPKTYDNGPGRRNIFLLDGAKDVQNFYGKAPKDALYLLKDYHEEAFFNADNVGRIFGKKEEEILTLIDGEEMLQAAKKGQLSKYLRRKSLWGRRNLFAKQMEEVAERLFAAS